MAKDHKTPLMSCPVCNHLFDGAFNVFDDRPPGEEDVTVCIECFALLKFTKNMDLEILTKEELKSLDQELQSELLYVRDTLKKRHEHH